MAPRVRSSTSARAGLFPETASGNRGLVIMWQTQNSCTLEIQEAITSKKQAALCEQREDHCGVFVLYSNVIGTKHPKLNLQSKTLERAVTKCRLKQFLKSSETTRNNIP